MADDDDFTDAKIDDILSELGVRPLTERERQCAIETQLEECRRMFEITRDLAEVWFAYGLCYDCGLAEPQWVSAALRENVTRLREASEHADSRAWQVRIADVFGFPTNEAGGPQ